MNIQIFPYNYENWKEVVEMINLSLFEWECYYSSVKDFIGLLWKIRSTLFSHPNNVFRGLSLFLMNLSCHERSHIMKINFRNILSSILDLEISLEKLISKEETFLNYKSLRGLLACSILCIMPSQPNSDCINNLNFDNLYSKINFGSTDCIKRFNEILRLFDYNSEFGLRKNSNINILPIENLINQYYNDTTWPIIIPISSNFYSCNINWVHIWPKSNNKDCSIQGPVLLPPCLMNNPCICYSKSGTHIIHPLRCLDPWPGLSSVSLDIHILASALCTHFSAISNLSTNKTANINLSNEKSIPRTPYRQRSLFQKRSRSSSNSSSQDLYRRHSSIYWSGNSPNHRYSYSSSGSRSGSLQITTASTISSRRSSGREDEQIGQQHDTVNSNNSVNNNNSSNPNQNSSHLQPIIVEESILLDEEEPHKNLENHIRNLMSAPITDHSKISLSREILRSFEDNKDEMNEMVTSYQLKPRRNSSPLIGASSPFILRQSQAHKLSTNIIRCCEEDAKRSILLNSATNSISPNINQFSLNTDRSVSRRQSLPCHLISINPKLDQSGTMYNNPTEHSSSDIDDLCGDILYIPHQHPLTNVFGMNQRSLPHISMVAESVAQLKSIVHLADRFVDELFTWHGSEGLAAAISSRSKSPLESNNPTINLFDHCSDQQKILRSQDLMKFDRELFTSTFFDDEAEECFRKLSTKPTSQIDMEILSNTSNNEYDRYMANNSAGCRQSLDAHAKAKLKAYADFIATEIIVEALCECRSHGKAITAPIMIHNCEDEFDTDFLLSMSIQLASAGLIQQPDSPLIIAVEIPNQQYKAQALLQLIDTIGKVQDHMTFSEFHAAVLSYFSGIRCNTQSNTANEHRPANFCSYLNDLIN